MVKQFTLALAFLTVLSARLMAGPASEQLEGLAASPDAANLNSGFEASRQASDSVQADAITAAPSNTVELAQNRQVLNAVVSGTPMPAAGASEKPADNRSRFERGYDWAVRPGKEAADQGRNSVIAVFGFFLYVALIPVGLAAGLANSLLGFIF